MEQTRKVTPQFFFLAIGTLITLIASVSAFLSLAFETLNHALPDVLSASYQYGYASYSYDTMRGALALLIIVFPVFLVLSRFWSKEVKKGMTHWNEVLRKWTLYLILFLASLTTIITLVTLVRYFVSGEITVRFILKVTLTLIVAGMTLWYYRGLLTGIVSKWNTWVLIKSIMLVLALIVWSFCVMGSPFAQRKLRLDERRVQDLQSIQYQVINFWQQKEKLPATLDELKNPISNYSIPVDPEFQKGFSYEYRKINDKSAKTNPSFELCATFALPMTKGWVENSSANGVFPAKDIAVATMPYPGGGANESWDHGVGRTCFEREIDPDLYPPYPKPEKN